MRPARRHCRGTAPGPRLRRRPGSPPGPRTRSAARRLPTTMCRRHCRRHPRCTALRWCVLPAPACPSRGWPEPLLTGLLQEMAHAAAHRTAPPPGGRCGRHGTSDQGGTAIRCPPHLSPPSAILSLLCRGSGSAVFLSSRRIESGPAAPGCLPRLSNVEPMAPSTSS